MSFTRRTVLTLLGAACVPVTSTKLFATPNKTYDLVPYKVGDGVWMVEGTTEYFTQENGGAIVNCALFETDLGMVIVDTGPSLRYGRALREAAHQINGRGIAACINTHHHPDHFFGNQVFADRPIYGLDRMISLAKTEGDAFSDNMYRLLGDWMRGTEVTPPTKTLDSSSLRIGNRSFRLIPLAGHTDSDLVLIDQKTGTLVSGDLAFLDRAPTTPHADISKWRESIEFLKSLANPGILPGHGPFDTAGKSLDQTLDYINWLERTLVQAANAGHDMMEIMEHSVPERFASMGAMPTEFHRSVSHLYPTIERNVMPLIK